MSFLDKIISGPAELALPVLAIARKSNLPVLYATSKQQAEILPRKVENISILSDEESGVSHGSFASGSVTVWTRDGPISGVTAGVQYMSSICDSESLLGAEAMDEAQVISWLNVASSSFGTSRIRAFLGEDRAMLITLVNIGIRFSSQQKVAVERVLKNIEKDKEFLEVLQGMENHLSRNTFLACSKQLTAADITVCASLYELIFAALAIAEVALDNNTALRFPSILRWARSIAQNRWFQDAAIATGIAIGGLARAGGQIDVRPQPRKAAVQADASIALNATSKRGVSQRDAEKAVKTSGSAPASRPKPKENKPATTTNNSSATSCGVTCAALGNVEPTSEQPTSNNTEGESPSATRIAKAEAKLQEYGIKYALYHHEPADTVDDLVKFTDKIDAGKAKNLFLKAKKAKEEGDSRMWLVIALHDTATDLKAIGKQLGYGNIVIRFGDPKTLATNLGTVKGNVSPLALMNDTALQVNVALDKRIVDLDKEILVHPLSNEASVSIKVSDLIAFIEKTGHKWCTIE